MKTYTLSELRYELQDGGEYVPADVASDIESERDRYKADYEELKWLAEHLQEKLDESRLDERQAMTYLEQCRQAVGHEGDFPSLVERLRELAG